MKVLMFGWEYPPHISGGLGTACYGLTKALSQKGVGIDFVVPRLFGDEPMSGARLQAADGFTQTLTRKEISKIEENISFTAIDSSILPYENEDDYLRRMNGAKNFANAPSAGADAQTIFTKRAFSFQGGYGENLFEEVERYALVAASIAKQKQFDVIHSHDWLCYKAGEVAKQMSGKPLVVHVHATEYDRSGENINRRIYDMEKQGMDAADVIVCVSEFTRKTVIEKYFQPPAKVICIHNGVELSKANAVHAPNPFGKKIVSFVGRITFQKGPDYFIEAAQKVLQKDKNFVFVMAGAGDMLNRMTALVAKKRISENFFFTGFLQGEELHRLLAMSDVYVMPSVSEPFGITPLEAMQAGVPTVISRQSGVSEVLKNAIKADFWDIDALAEAVYAIGNYKMLSRMLSREGKKEAERITWDKAAERLMKLYNKITR